MSENCWFEEWFNTRYYHMLYKNRDDNEAQMFIDNLLSKLNPPKSSKILDVACGKGRHSKYMNSKGFDVTGIDLSSESITEAREFENDTLQFYEHDMRNLFRVNYFDYAFNLFTSFGYFENEIDNIKALSAIVDGLKKDKFLVIDFFNSNFVQANIVHKYNTTIDNVIFDTEKYVEGNCIIKKITVNDNGEKHYYKEKVQLLNLEKFNSYFTQVGLKFIDAFGNYYLDKFDEVNSPRLIILAQKE